ncbi:hypothetical protein DXU07_22375 [Bradyrhizobium elkanii]
MRRARHRRRYGVTYGIVQMAMPSPTWYTISAAVCAIAVSTTAFIRFTGMTAPEPTGLILPGTC